MKHCCNAWSKRAIRNLSVALMAVFTATGCTEVNDGLGFSLVPGDQQMAVALDTLYGFDTYIMRTDSVPAHGVGVVFLGSREDDTYGTTSGKAVMQFSPEGFYDSSVKFGPQVNGVNPTPDSMIIRLVVNNFLGDTTVTQDFEIFELTEPIFYTDTYFIDYDPSSLFNPAEPLISFSHEGQNDMYFTLRYADGDQKVNDFMQRLIDLAYENEDAYTTNNVNNLERDSIFHLSFYGLHVRPTSTSRSDAALYSIDTDNVYNDVYSTIILYSHYYAEEATDPTVSYHTYVFDTGSYTLNASISMVAHDYSAVPLGQLINTTDDPTEKGPVETSYVQTLGGVYTGIHIDKDQLLQAMETFKTHQGVAYRDIAVNQARLEVRIDEQTAEKMNRAPARMGLYYDYQWLWRRSSVTGTYGNMPLVLDDYMYELEDYYTIPFDGNLNRSRGFYNMDISTYVQQLLKDPEGTQKDIYLAPDVSWTFGMRDVMLTNPASGEDRIKLILTYTLVK